jgi:hypothetical protein
MTTASHAQTLQTKFSCSAVSDDGGEKITLADSGEIDLHGSQIKTFRWESDLYRRTHGFDCSIDDDDGLQAEVRNESAEPAWRIALKDGRAARLKRGYTFERGVNCTIRLERAGDSLKVRPTCPALCGSRTNFSEIVIDLKTGSCSYE